jgi:hypothetical protein
LAVGRGQDLIMFIRTKKEDLQNILMAERKSDDVLPPISFIFTFSIFIYRFIKTVRSHAKQKSKSRKALI